MKRYEFRAVRPKQEMITGLAFPIVFMLPIGAARLVVQGEAGNVLKSMPSALVSFGIAVIALAMVEAIFYVIGRLQKKIVKNYAVEIHGARIQILENEKEILAGTVSDCEVLNKIKGGATDNITMVIYTDTGKITFRLRSKEWRTVTGNRQNPFGTSDAHDMEMALALGNHIKEMLENHQ